MPILDVGRKAKGNRVCYNQHNRTIRWAGGTDAPAPKLASKTPKKTRQTINWVIFCTAPEHMAQVPQSTHKAAT
jgi:hypothetical protein